jgi:hypothetical protein
MTENEWEDAAYFCLDRVGAEEARRALGASWRVARETLPFGGIVGIARLTGIVYPENVRSAVRGRICTKAEKWHMHEQYGFVLEQVRRLPFVPCKGMRFFFDVGDEVLCDLDQAIRCPRDAERAEAANG